MISTYHSKLIKELRDVANHASNYFEVKDTLRVHDGLYRFADAPMGVPLIVVSHKLTDVLGSHFAERRDLLAGSIIIKPPNKYNKSLCEKHNYPSESKVLNIVCGFSKELTNVVDIIADIDHYEQKQVNGYVVPLKHVTIKGESFYDFEIPFNKYTTSITPMVTLHSKVTISNTPNTYIKVENQPSSIVVKVYTMKNSKPFNSNIVKIPKSVEFYDLNAPTLFDIAVQALEESDIPVHEMGANSRELLEYMRMRNIDTSKYTDILKLIYNNLKDIHEYEILERAVLKRFYQLRSEGVLDKIFNEVLV